MISAPESLLCALWFLVASLRRPDLLLAADSLSVQGV